MFPTMVLILMTGGLDLRPSLRSIQPPEDSSIQISKSKFSHYTTRFTLKCRRHDDLKEMLDSNKDSLKLEAMKRIIGVKIKLFFTSAH